MKATRIHHRLARHASSLLLLLALTVATVQGAWGQVKGDQYLSSLGTQEGSMIEVSEKRIQHKDPKWFDLREQLNLPEHSLGTFSYDRPRFDPISSSATEGIQAAHTYIDTIYMHKGKSIDLELPTKIRSGSEANIPSSAQTYQRWYSYRTDGTFRTNETGADDVWDLLTPISGTAYRFANGYVGCPLSDKVVQAMNFYYPTNTEFEEWFPQAAGNPNLDNDWYVVACDVSGYTDFTENYPGSDPINNQEDWAARFRSNGFYEPTLTVRVIFYIVGVDERDNSSSPDKAENWRNGHGRLSTSEYQGGGTSGKYLEEYDITFPSKHLSNKTDELVALSKDARSYAIPDVVESSGLKVTLADNTAGISLVTESLSGAHNTAERIIRFRVQGANANTPWEVEDGSTATILVTKQVTGGDGSTTTYNIARFNLTFEDNTVPLTQTQVAGLGTADAAGKDWNFEYRSPAWMRENLDSLTALTFNYDPTVADIYGNAGYQKEYFPFPMEWEHSSYGFFDGSQNGDYIQGGDIIVEWSYYAIANDYIGYAEIHNGAVAPPSGVGKDPDGYFLYIDTSDRPGIIAQLPFDERLCRGSELFVTAWLKSGGSNALDSDDAAVLFTIMGVNADGSYTPLYRHSSSQIRRTDLLTADDPGTGTGNNQWYQVYFSFMNNSDETANFNSYVLQIENNSASTKGGDIYVDDIKVFIGRPNAVVTQKEYTCTNERTRMNIEMDWDRLLSRLGGEGGTGENGFSFCFIDETDYNNYLASHPGSIAEAIDHSIVEIGDGEVINTRIMSMYFMNRFEDNDPVGTSTLPGNEGDNVADGDYFFAYQHMKDGKPYFYRTGSEDEAAGRRLTVDFYSVLSPNRPYIMLIIPATPEDGDGGMSEDDLIDYFATQMGDACSIQTRFYVESEAVIKVNGEVIDPSQTFCAGQVFNFSAQLRVPTGVDDEGNDTYDVLDEGVYFDWFFGTEEEFLATDATAGTSLQAALLDFRAVYPDATELSETETPTGTFSLADSTQVEFSRAEFDLIQRYDTSSVVTGGMHRRLVLHRENLDITLLNTGLQLVIQPIQTLVPPEGSGISKDQWAQICWNYIPVLLSVSGNAPQLHPGFNTVTYPAVDFNPALRIGLKQIRETAVGGNGTALRMDLRGAVIITDGATHLGKIETSEGMDMLYLVDSDDPDYSGYFTGTDFNEYSLPIGQIEELHAEVYGSGSYNDYMTLRFDLSKQANDFQFAPKEGYTYTFSVHFEEKGEAEDEVYNSCYGSFNVRMKVVPEYLKWTGTALDNWNNDDHWQRLSGDELHYTPTDAEVRDHVTDGGINDNTKGFVPMLFSNVVMPADSRAQLYMAGYADGGAAWTGSDNRPEGMGDPTENIQYDLMVYEQNNRLTTQRYRVNICRDIHFMPGAQLLHAEQLIYNRAWTDVPVPAKQWTLISTPLQGVVAGDWYTTTKGTQANEPYFRDITFNDENDRLNPAVYQRSWDQSATIVEQGGQTAPAHFSAAWSSVFNDAYVPYVPGGGFSIKTAAAGSGNGLQFRLPKADTEYGVSTGTLNREGAGKLLVTDLLDRSNPLVYSPKESVTARLTSSQDGKYLIVGNPFMAPLDLQKFFDGNTHLQPKYWTETEEGPAVGSADDESHWIETIEGATIPPYGAFFVEKAEGATGNTVSFTADMQTFGTATGETTGTNSLVVTAENASGRSRAALAYAYAATDGYRAEEDAQLIADLTGDGTAAPVVYTVAGDVAASVNRLHAQRQVPLGLFAAEEAQTLLTFSGVSALRNPRLYDAVAGTETPLAEGYTLTLAGASHGRYFLRSDGSTATGIGDEQAGDEARLTAYSVRRGEVIVSADVPLRTVQVYSVGGLLLDGSEPSADASVCRFDGLPSGVAVVRATMADGRTAAVKVAVQ